MYLFGSAWRRCAKYRVWLGVCFIVCAEFSKAGTLPFADAVEMTALEGLFPFHKKTKFKNYSVTCSSLHNMVLIFFTIILNGPVFSCFSSAQSLLLSLSQCLWAASIWYFTDLIMSAACSEPVHFHRSPNPLLYWIAYMWICLFIVYTVLGNCALLHFTYLFQGDVLGWSNFKTSASKHGQTTKMKASSHLQVKGCSEHG